MQSIMANLFGSMRVRLSSGNSRRPLELEYKATFPNMIPRHPSTTPPSQYGHFLCDLPPACLDDPVREFQPCGTSGPVDPLLCYGPPSLATDVLVSTLFSRPPRTPIEYRLVCQADKRTSRQHLNPLVDQPTHSQTKDRREGDDDRKYQHPFWPPTDHGQVGLLYLSVSFYFL